MEKFRSWEPLGASLPGRVDPPKRREGTSICQKKDTTKDPPKNWSSLDNRYYTKVGDFNVSQIPVKKI